MQKGRGSRPGAVEQKAAPQDSGRSCAGSLAVFGGIASVVIILDLFTKWLAFDRLSPRQPFPVIRGLLNFHLSSNLGAVFGIGQGMRAVFIIFTVIAALGIVWAASRYGRHSRLLNIGLALLLGGALGNLYDRIVHTAVRDFIDLYAGTRHWPTFNVADIAICCGAGIVILHAFLHPQPKES